MNLDVFGDKYKYKKIKIEQSYTELQKTWLIRNESITNLFQFEVLRHNFKSN